MPVDLLSPAYCDAMNCYATCGEMRIKFDDAAIDDWLLMLDSGGEL